MLSAFSNFDHLVYLKNVNQPIIAFFASAYLLKKDLSTQYFKRTTLGQYQEQAQFTDFNALFQPTNSNYRNDFNGGLIGFISYDAAAQQHINLQEKLQPSLFLGIYRSYLKLTAEGWTFFSNENEAEAIFERIENELKTQKNLCFSLKQPCVASWNKNDYFTAFKQVQNYIKAGDCYQINLTQQFTSQAEGLLLAIAEEIWTLTNAPYAGYIRINDFEILSCSPELFMDFKNDRKMITRPIKGTMPRYADPDLDQQSKQKLIQSEKDQAENLMIVDLMRNDLSLYAETGSVKTTQLFEIESFNQVHHMVSEVTATLKPQVHPLDVLMSALPGGSITGAPKIRAMQIIDELESAPRGAYCGSMGYFNFDGTGSWNILIRSIQKYQETVSLSAGGGVTIASDADAEYQECFDKVSAMLDLLNRYYQNE
jgi:para-aminobenzoate synthetase component 1